MQACPDCQRRYTIIEESDREVRVSVEGTTPVAPCCMRAATDGHRKTGVFVTGD
jgi:hypothetical protein